MIDIMLSIGMIVAFFFIIGYLNPHFKLKIISFGFGLIEIIIAYSLVYLDALGKSYTGLMEVNFWALLIIGFGVGMISMIIYTLNAVNLDNRDEEKKWVFGSDSKWQR